MAVGDVYILGDDGLWHLRGAPDVVPGGIPSGGTDPNAVPLFQLVGLNLTSSGTVTGGTGGGTGGGTTTPPATAGSGYCGACPVRPGGTSLAVASTVVTKWGTGAAIRQFADTTTGGPYHPAGASRVHTSWNFPDAGVANGDYDATIAAMAARAHDGDVMDHRHERDNDSGMDAAAITLYIKAKNRFYDVVKNTNPNVLVAFTTTGGFWYNSVSDSRRDQWIATQRGDLFGFDYDGVHDKDDAGPDYDISAPTTEIANIKRYLSKYGSTGKWKGWTTPEFGTSRRPWDTTGTPRADWFTAGGNELLKGGSYMVCVFDYNSDQHNLSNDYNELKTGTPEYTAWKKFVSANPAA